MLNNNAANLRDSSSGNSKAFIANLQPRKIDQTADFWVDSLLQEIDLSAPMHNINDTGNNILNDIPETLEFLSTNNNNNLPSGDVNVEGKHNDVVINTNNTSFSVRKRLLDGDFLQHASEALDLPLLQATDSNSYFIEGSTLTCQMLADFNFKDDERKF